MRSLCIDIRSPGAVYIKWKGVWSRKLTQWFGSINRIGRRWSSLHKRMVLVTNFLSSQLFWAENFSSVLPEWRMSWKGGSTTMLSWKKGDVRIVVWIEEGIQAVGNISRECKRFGQIIIRWWWGSKCGHIFRRGLRCICECWYLSFMRYKSLIVVGTAVTTKLYSVIRIDETLRACESSSNCTIESRAQRLKRRIFKISNMVTEYMN